MKSPRSAHPLRARSLAGLLLLALMPALALRAQTNPPLSGPPFLGVPLIDMKISVATSPSGVEVHWVNAKPALIANYQVYRLNGTSATLLTPSPVRATAFSDRPVALPRTAVTYEVRAYWSDNSTGVSGPMSVTIPTVGGPVQQQPGPVRQAPGIGRCFGIGDLSGVQVFSNPSPGPQGGIQVYLQVDFPSPTQYPGGAKVVVKDNQKQTVTTYNMTYLPTAATDSAGFHPGYVYSLLLGTQGQPAQVSLDLTVQAINADCTYHMFSSHWQNANSML